MHAYRDVRNLQRIIDGRKIGISHERKQTEIVRVEPFHVKPDRREKIFVSVKPGAPSPSQEYLAEYIINGPCIGKALRSIQVLCGEYAKGVEMQQASGMLFNALFTGKLKFKTAIRIIDVLAGLPGNTLIGITADHSPGFGYYAENFRKFVLLVEEGKIFTRLAPEQRTELVDRVPGWRSQY